MHIDHISFIVDLLWSKNPIYMQYCIGKHIFPVLQCCNTVDHRLSQQQANSVFTSFDELAISHNSSMKVKKSLRKHQKDFNESYLAMTNLWSVPCWGHRINVNFLWQDILPKTFGVGVKTDFRLGGDSPKPLPRVWKRMSWFQWKTLGKRQEKILHKIPVFRQPIKTQIKPHSFK